jgi:hypothetical protein
VIPKSGCRFSEKIMLQNKGYGPAPFACVAAADAYIEAVSLYDIPDTP